jgi:predicted transposase YbfD/YdcC
VLAHIEIDEKSNEIPAVQKLLGELDVAGHIVTCDAMHCQKNRPSLRLPVGIETVPAYSGRGRERSTNVWWH